MTGEEAYGALKGKITDSITKITEGIKEINKYEVIFSNDGDKHASSYITINLQKESGEIIVTEKGPYSKFDVSGGVAVGDLVVSYGYTGYKGYYWGLFVSSDCKGFINFNDQIYKAGDIILEKRYDSSNETYNMDDILAFKSGASLISALNPSTGDQTNIQDILNNMSTGGGHVYSTEEQVVGKWIDGRDIYEKTIILENPVVNAWGVIPRNTGPLDLIIYCNGFILTILDTEPHIFMCVGMTNSVESDRVSLQLPLNRDAIDYKIGSTFSNTSSITVTLQYIKKN